MTEQSRQSVEMLDDFLPLDESDWKKISAINNGQKLGRIFNAVAGAGLLAIPVTMGLGVGPFADLGFADQSFFDSAVKVVGHSVLFSGMYCGIASLSGIFEHSHDLYQKLCQTQTQKIRAVKEEDFAAAIDSYIAETNLRLQKGEKLNDEDYKILAMFEDKELARLKHSEIDFKRWYDARAALGDQNPRTLFMERKEHGSARKNLGRYLSPTETFCGLLSLMTFTMPLYFLWHGRNEKAVTGEDVIVPRPARPDLRKLAL